MPGATNLFKEDDGCIICKGKFTDGTVGGKLVKATSKGINSLQRFSLLHNDEHVQLLLSTESQVVKYHSECFKTYTNERLMLQQKKRHRDEPAMKSTSLKLLRSSSSDFLWKEHCFLCAQQITLDSRYVSSRDIYPVRTLELRSTLLESCRYRNDEWGLCVSGRLESCNDLVAEEAMYHKQCYSNFTTGRRNPKDENGNDLHYRGTDETKRAAFETLCSWLESSSELYSIKELHEIMMELAGPNSDVYSEKYLKQLILEKYQGDVVISEIAGKNNVLCFKNTASRILTHKWYTEREENIDDESRRIVVAAAKLIRSQIRDRVYCCTEYPKTSSFSDIKAAKDWVPSLLMSFMEAIVPNDLKQVALCHSVIQAARQRSTISPVLFGVGVTLDNAYGSRSLLEMLSRLGFSLSYEEVNRYKQSVVQSEDNEIPSPFPVSFTQWSADNMDHNINTLNGLNTFHGMGIVSMSTSSTRDIVGRYTENTIPRMQRFNVAHIVKNKGIPIISYSMPEKSALSLLKLKPLNSLQFHVSSKVSLQYDLAWQAGWFFSNAEQPRPNWSGFMQESVVPINDFLPPADIRMLPLIDLNPNDVTCIYSTLRFIEQQAERLCMKTACITFDQPLWLKAVNIVLTERMNIVCRLGGFHTIMSYLGAIGTIMSGSGLSDALQTCYGSSTITHMMSGKAVSRAIRGHLLTDGALHALLLQNIVNSEEIKGETMDDLQSMYTDLLDNTFIPQEGTDILPNCIERLHDSLVACKSELSSQSRTASLWIQYIDCIQILKDFIRADRTCDWSLHLNSLRKMLPLFAAAGHRNYTKSVRLYLEQMSELPHSHPWLYEQLSNGLHSALMEHLQSASLSVCQAAADADMLIVTSALSFAKSRGSVTVVANDTDILVMLLHHFSPSMSDIYMHMETNKQAPIKWVCIRTLSLELGQSTVRQLPVIHALSGCDTTSSIFGHGKASIFKSLISNKAASHWSEVMSCTASTKDDIARAGINLLILIYGGKIGNSLNNMRYTTYMNIIASSSLPPRPERLPPTESAAKQHAFRAHIQVIQWKTLLESDKKPEDWGWTLVQNHYLPITSDCPPAPPDLLKLIKCSCKIETTRPCSTSSCSCVKHGLPCLASCKHCCGSSCENSNVSSNYFDEGLVVPDSDHLSDLLEDVMTTDDAVCDEHIYLEIPWIDEEVIE